MMLCLKKRRTYSFTQGVCSEAPRRHRRRSASSSRYNDHPAVNKLVAAQVAPAPLAACRPREKNSSAMVLTVTEDTPADMLAGSMELLVQIPRDEFMQTQRVTVQRSTPMMDLLVQIATAHKLAASSYTLQAIGERGLVLPHQPNTPIGALDALQVKLLPKQGTFVARKGRQSNQPFETTFRLQVHLPRNQLYVSRVSPKTILGEILEEVCREKNLDRNKYELRHPGNIRETLNPSLTLQDYQIQEVHLYPRPPVRAVNNQDIMSYQRQEDYHRHQQQRQAQQQQQQQSSRHHGVFGLMVKKLKESSVKIDSLDGQGVSPVRNDEAVCRATSVRQTQIPQLLQEQQQQQQQFVAPPAPSRPLRKRRPAPKPPCLQQQQQQSQVTTRSKKASEQSKDLVGSDRDKMVISHSRNSSDSSGYHEASVLSDNPDNGNGAARMPETLPRRSSRMQGILESPRKLAHTAHASKSLSNLALPSSQVTGIGTASGTLSRGISNTSLSSTGQRKKRAAPAPPLARPLPSAISVQGLERIVDSDESLTSDMELSKPSSDIEAAATGSSQASSDIACQLRPLQSVHEQKLQQQQLPKKTKKPEHETVASCFVASCNAPPAATSAAVAAAVVEPARVDKRELVPPVPRPRKAAPISPVELPSKAPRRANSSSHRPPDDPKNLAVSNGNGDGVNRPTSGSKGPELPARLPSLTDDERAEINLAIDSIVVAATGHSADSADENSSSDEADKTDYSGKQTRKAENVCSAEDDARPGCLKLDTALQLNPSPADVPFPNPSTPPPRTEFIDSKTSIAVVEAAEAKQANDEPTNNYEQQSVESSGLPEGETVGQQRTIGNPQEPNPEAEAEKTKSQLVLLHKRVKAELRAVELALEASNVIVDVEPKSCSSSSAHKVKFSADEEVAEADGCSPSLSCAVISAIPKSNANSSSSNDTTATSVDATSKQTERAKNKDEKEELLDGESTLLGTGKSTSPTDTDILLQKVSDTLSQALEAPSSPTAEGQPESVRPSTSLPAKLAENQCQQQSQPDGAQIFSNNSKSTAKIPKLNKSPVKEEKEEKKEEVAAEVEEEKPRQREVTSIDDSAQNLTVTSQQDTSDYVSASGEDLSIGDWEYQIPAPPSAFRDDSEHGSTSVIKETKVSASSCLESRDSTNFKEQMKKKESQEERQEEEERERQVSSEKEAKIKCKSSEREEEAAVPAAAELGKNEEFSCRAGAVASPAAPAESEGRTNQVQQHPKIQAPIENNLANFTITTYSRQRSLDIFEEDRSNGRLVDAVATLTRAASGSNRSLAASDQLDGSSASQLKPAASVASLFSAATLSQNAERREAPSVREKPVHRSKSHILLSSNDKLPKVAAVAERREPSDKSNNIQAQRLGLRDDAASVAAPHVTLSKSFVNSSSLSSSTSLLASTNNPKSKEKFSQWRDNILKKQEEPSKETQLQSLQVLKSILPQLKNSHTIESLNSCTATSDSLGEKKGARQESQNHVVSTSSAINANAAATASDTTSTGETVKLRPAAQRQQRHEPSKRFTYAGPPTVSLVSWSERPSLNVQIKNDTDYKLGGSGFSGARTVVNLNADCKPVEFKPSSVVAPPPNKPQQQQFNNEQHPPAVVQHECSLVKPSREKKEKQENEEKGNYEAGVDTSSVSFSELTKAFGQVELRARLKKPGASSSRGIEQRRSEYLERSAGIESTENGFSDNAFIANNNNSGQKFRHEQIDRPAAAAFSPVKRYTSIIGITNANHHLPSKDSTQQSHSRLIDGPSRALPLQQSINNLEKASTIPKPPTMPIITGVTLKSVSARPKSSPPTIQHDPRNQLLESIRNFGGREKLRKATEGR